MATGDLLIVTMPLLAVVSSMAASSTSTEALKWPAIARDLTHHHRSSKSGCCGPNTVEHSLHSNLATSESRVCRVPTSTKYTICEGESCAEPCPICRAYLQMVRSWVLCAKAVFWPLRRGLRTLAASTQIPNRWWRSPDVSLRSLRSPRRHRWEVWPSARIRRAQSCP